MQLVVSPVDTWVAVHADSGGEPGLQLGRTFVPAGVNHDVVVGLAPAPDTGPLYLLLYADRGEPRAFDAQGVDPVLTGVDGRVIRVPFSLTE